MKKAVCLFIAMLMLTGCLCSCKKDKKAEINMSDIIAETGVTPENVTVTDQKTDYVMIDVREYGKIVIHLYPDAAPITVENFKKLVSEHFYDGIIFHRVIKDFMIQCGDPGGDGTGGSSEKIKGEFSANGVENPIKHVRGTVSMARTQVYDSASSQFFICQADYSYGDGQYAAFGFVVSGMDVVDAIADVKTNSNNKPRTDVVIDTIRFVEVSK